MSGGTLLLPFAKVCNLQRISNTFTFYIWRQSRATNTSPFTLLVFKVWGSPHPRHLILYLRLAWNSWYSPHLEWTPGNLLLHHSYPLTFLLKTFKGPFRMVDFWVFPSPLYFCTCCLAFRYSVNLYNLARLLSFDLGNTEEYYCPLGSYTYRVLSHLPCPMLCMLCETDSY